MEKPEIRQPFEKQSTENETKSNLKDVIQAVINLRHLILRV